jgi:hypothetical protein
MHGLLASTMSPYVQTAHQISIHQTTILPYMRANAWNSTLKAFKMHLPLTFLQRLLGFSGENGGRLQTFLRENGAVFVDGELFIDVDKSKAIVK